MTEEQAWRSQVPSGETDRWACLCYWRVSRGIQELKSSTLFFFLFIILLAFPESFHLHIHFKIGLPAFAKPRLPQFSFD